MRADIRQVAAEAGVSTATVSRVLTGRGPASPETADKVRRAAERLGYSPSASASSLRTDRSMIIGVLVPNLANPVYLPFLRAVEHLAQRHGYAVIVADTQRSRQVERRQLDRLSAQRVDALVVAGRSMDPDHLRRLADAGLPVADAEAFTLQADALAASLGTAVDAACDHLAELGHRRLAFLTRGTRRRGASDARWRLIETAGRTRGLNVERIVLKPSSGRRDPGGSDLASRLERLVRPPDGPTVLWSSSHTLTPELLGGLAAVEVTIPLECSFLTFGDSPWAAVYRPAISVITGDLGSVGTAMTEALLHRLGATHSEPRWDIEPDRYVRRDSVARAPR
ncbi:MAG TPA: LacI family DNA-binding transcriptional regulator [Acidimicrobiales bacterium]|nr:LacI family DNA-binding transcriptional regulator [Acidimicrobiales bacterium]